MKIACFDNFKTSKSLINIIIIGIFYYKVSIELTTKNVKPNNNVTRRQCISTL